MWVWEPGASQFWIEFWTNIFAFPLAVLIGVGTVYLAQWNQDRRQSKRNDIRQAVLVHAVMIELVFNIEWARSAKEQLEKTPIKIVAGKPTNDGWNSVRTEIVELGLPLDTALPKVYATHAYYDNAYDALKQLNQHAIALEHSSTAYEETSDRISRLRELGDAVITHLDNAIRTSEDVNGILEEYIRELQN